MIMLKLNNFQYQKTLATMFSPFFLSLRSLKLRIPDSLLPMTTSSTKHSSSCHLADLSVPPRAQQSIRMARLSGFSIALVGSSEQAPSNKRLTRRKSPTLSLRIGFYLLPFVRGIPVFRNSRISQHHHALDSCPSRLTKKICLKDILGQQWQTPLHKLMDLAELLQTKHKRICCVESAFSKNLTTFLAAQWRQVRDLTLCDVFSASSLAQLC